MLYVKLYFLLLHNSDCGTEADVFPLHIAADERLCPAEKPFRLVTGHIYAAMTHCHSKIVMPVSSMECDPGLRYKIAAPGRTRKLISIHVICHLSLSHVMG